MLQAVKDTISTKVKTYKDNYKKPTPKGWLLASRILKVVGRVAAGTSLLGVLGPWVGLAALSAGEIIGEVLKFKTEK